MARSIEYKGWKYVMGLAFDGKKLVEYSISFYQRSPASEWYDEIRYDSHERKRGRKILAPHLHVKLLSAFKEDADKAVEEIKKIIDNYVGQLEGVIK